MEFCKAFNERTKEKAGLTLPAVITVYEDRSFTFIVKTAPTSVLLKKAVGIAKASGVPNREKIGKINQKQLEEIAEQKMPDLTAANPENAMRTVMGTMRSMGIELEK